MFMENHEIKVAPFNNYPYVEFDHFIEDQLLFD